MTLLPVLRRYWFACGIGLLAIAATGSAALILSSALGLQGLNLKGVPADAPAAGDVKCGPRALWVAARRLGISVEPDQLSTIPVHPVEGASLGDLKAAAQTFGLRAQTVQVSFDELAKHPGTAILFVRGNHFVAADLRERDWAEDSTQRIRVYDSEKLAAWWSRKELEAVWSGAALLLDRPDPGPARPVGPQIRWDTCWQDHGVISDSDVARFSFVFRNTGTSPLTAEIGRASCKCTTADLSSKMVPPGETGTLFLTVNLATLRGQFVEDVTVRTNDPAHPVTRVVLCGGAMNDLVSARAIHWGSARVGQTIKQRFAVYDPGQGRLQIDGVEWVPWRQSSTTTQAKCRLTTQRVGQKSSFDNLSPPMTVSDGDYVVEIELQFPDDIPLGKIGGSVWVKTNLPGKWARFDVALEGQVLSDIEASPAALVLSGAPSQPVTVRIRSFLGKSVMVEKVVVAGGIPVRAGEARASADGTAEVSVQCVSDPSARSREGILVCHLRGGRFVEIPVVILNPEPP